MHTGVLACLVAVAAAQNPFERKPWYVNPSYQRDIRSSMAKATGATRQTLSEMTQVPSAYWIDVMGKLHAGSGRTGTDTVEGILADAASKSPPELVTFIVYDLPNRDCHAKASNGEICCTTKSDGRCDYLAPGDGKCTNGLNTYKRNYIDPLAAILARYRGRVPVVTVIEPDSLPNLVTNLKDPRCSNPETQTAYKEGIRYAVDAIARASPSTAIYLDGAHGGWLGWKNNLQGFEDLVKSMNVLPRLRGFSTNVANYRPVGKACPAVGHCVNGQNKGDPCCRDPCGLSGQWNAGHNEANYVQALSERFPGKYFIVDTGRNGVDDAATDCSNWCNVRGAGVGQWPTTTTPHPMMDALYWLKTPGESDGCTEQLPSGGMCPRFDSACGSKDSLGSQAGEPRSPEAGKWFDYQIQMLARNANLYPNGQRPPSAPTPAGRPQCQVASGWELCKGNEACCPAGKACHAFNDAVSVCHDHCPTGAGWACDPNRGCLEHQGWKHCKGNEGCCPAGTKCQAFNDAVSVCHDHCPAGWACKQPAQAKPQCRVAQGWELCKGNETCCPAGKKCYAYSSAVSLCHDQCLAGWACY